METEALEQLVKALAGMWFLWLPAGGIALARLLLWLNERRTLARSGIAEIDVMDGRTFEHRLGVLFRALGFSVEQTEYRGDYGADLVVAKNGVRTVVQAKRWTKNVGIKAVQEAHASAAMYRCTRSMVVTNRYYSSQAKKLAHVNDVTLWDRDDLVPCAREHVAHVDLASVTAWALRPAGTRPSRARPALRGCST